MSGTVSVQYLPDLQVSGVPCPATGVYANNTDELEGRTPHMWLACVALLFEPG
jgi:hypothetical protein